MSLTLFIEYFSQPSRAVLAFCSQAKIPHKVEEIRLKKGSNKTPEYKKISPLGKVPAILHGDFALSESHAIMTYLASVFPVEDHWYPKDPVQRAKIDMYLHWHHANIREAFGSFIFNKYMGPTVYNIPFNKDINDFCVKRQETALKYLESVLEAGFVGNSEKPSIGDISCYCELVQTKIVGYDFGDYKNLTKWMQKIEALPGVIEAHKFFHSLLPKIIGKN